MAFKFICVAVLLLTVPVKALEIQLEAEHSTDFQGTVMERSEASNRRTVRLPEDGYIVSNFQTATTSCLVTVSNISYTNDDDSDTVTVSIDGNIINSIEATFLNVTADHINFWNVILNSAPLGSTQLASGSHYLRVFINQEATGIAVNDTIDPGVEIDMTTLTLNCDGDVASVITETGSSKDDSEDVSSGGVAGIVTTIVTVIGGIGGSSILAYLKWTKKACFKLKKKVDEELGKRDDGSEKSGSTTSLDDKGDDGSKKSGSTASPNGKRDDGSEKSGSTTSLDDKGDDGSKKSGSTASPNGKRDDRIEKTVSPTSPNEKETAV